MEARIANICVFYRGSGTRISVRVNSGANRTSDNPVPVEGCHLVLVCLVFSIISFFFSSAFMGIFQQHFNYSAPESSLSSKYLTLCLGFLHHQYLYQSDKILWVVALCCIGLDHIRFRLQESVTKEEFWRFDLEDFGEWMDGWMDPHQEKCGWCKSVAIIIFAQISDILEIVFYLWLCNLL